VVGRQNADTADTLQLRDVAMVTDCGTTLAAYFLWTLTADNGMRLSYKGWCVFSQALRLLVPLSGFVVAAIGTAPGGRLSGSELTRWLSTF